MYYNLIPLMNKTPAFLPAAQTYFDRVVFNGGSLTNNEKTYINTFIGALGTDFAEFDRLWIHGLADSVAARTSVANPTSTMASVVNSPTFTASQGYTGNGTNSYLNTNYTPSTQGVKFTQNSACIFVYARNNVMGDHIDLGGVSGSNKSFVISRYSGGLAYYPIGLNTSVASPGIAVPTSAGLTVANRDTINLSVYKNGIQLAPLLRAAELVNTAPYYILSYNLSGTAASFSAKQISLSGVGSGIINQTTFYNAVQALGTSIGWAV